VLEPTPIQPPLGTYLVTGANGFIGTHLIRRLTKAGCEVVAADMAPKASLQRKVVQVRCDVRKRPFVRAAATTRKIDYVVHLAALLGDWGAPSAFEAVNVTGTRHVLEETLAAGAKRVLHVSSIAAMGFEPGEGASEDAPLVTDSDAYSATKARGELVARDLASEGAPVTVVRPGDVYGVGSEPWVNRPLRMLKKRQMVFVDGGQGHFGHVHVDNLIDGFLLALASDRAVGRAYIVTDAEQDTTFRDYFTRLADAAGLPRPSISLPRPAALVLARGLERAARLFRFTPPITETAVRFVTKRCSYSITRARAELGYAPRVTLDEGMRRLAEALATPPP
jgi:nucleoside-diphosphate-sugar epimerase